MTRNSIDPKHLDGSASLQGSVGESTQGVPSGGDQGSAPVQHPTMAQLFARNGELLAERDAYLKALRDIADIAWQERHPVTPKSEPQTTFATRDLAWLEHMAPDMARRIASLESHHAQLVEALRNLLPLAEAFLDSPNAPLLVDARAVLASLEGR